MRLAPEEAAILAGARGEAARDALDYQLKVGEFFGAERFVPITNVHMMGDIEVMGDGGLGWLRGECAKRARACVPTTTNARCFDFEHAERLGQDPGEVAKERELIAALRANGRPHHRHLHQLPDALPAAPRRARRLGRHRHRDLRQLGIRRALATSSPARPRSPQRSPAARPSTAFTSTSTARAPSSSSLEARARGSRRLGRGGEDRRREAPELLRGARSSPAAARTPTADELKHLGAALASYGSMGMFHMVGVTPEAPTLAAALGGNLPVGRDRDRRRGDRARLRRLQTWATGARRWSCSPARSSRCSR